GVLVRALGDVQRVARIGSLVRLVVHRPDLRLRQAAADLARTERLMLVLVDVPGGQARAPLVDVAGETAVEPSLNLREVPGLRAARVEVVRLEEVGVVRARRRRSRAVVLVRV